MENGIIKYLADGRVGVKSAIISGIFVIFAALITSSTTCISNLFFKNKDTIQKANVDNSIKKVETYHNSYGYSESKILKIAEELGVTRNALNNFFKVLEQSKVPVDELYSKLHEIATDYKKLQSRLNRIVENSTISIIQEKLGETLSQEGLFNNKVAEMLFDLGSIYLGRANYSEMCLFFEQALSIYSRIGYDYEIVINILNSLFSYYKKAEEYDTAVVYLKQIVEIYNDGIYIDHENYFNALMTLSNIFFRKRSEIGEKLSHQYFLQAMSVLPIETELKYYDIFLKNRYGALASIWKYNIYFDELLKKKINETKKTEKK